MSVTQGGGAVERCPVRTPDALAEALLPTDRLLLLIHHRAPGAPDADPALRLAEAVGRRRPPTLFLDLSRARSVVSGGAERDRPRGLSDVLGGGVGFIDVTVRDPLRSYMYVPAGRLDGDRARTLEALLATPLLERARDRGGTVLVSVREEDLPAGRGRTPFDAAVPIGHIAPPYASRLAGGVPVPARLARSREREAAPAERTSELTRARGPGRPRPPARRRRARTPSGIVVPTRSRRLAESRTSWWYVLGLCVLAAVLGTGILAATSEDSWVRNLYLELGPEWPAATSGD